MSVNSKMTAIANQIRSLLGLTDRIGLDAMATNLNTANSEVASQAELISQIAAALEGKTAGSSGGGGLTPATLTMTDFDAKCTLGYQNVQGELRVVTGPAYGSTYEIGVPSIVAALNSAGGGSASGNATVIYTNNNDVAIYAQGDCTINFLGK